MWLIWAHPRRTGVVFSRESFTSSSLWLAPHPSEPPLMSITTTATRTGRASTEELRDDGIVSPHLECLSGRCPSRWPPLTLPLLPTAAHATICGYPCVADPSAPSRTWPALSIPLLQLPRALSARPHDTVTCRSLSSTDLGQISVAACGTTTPDNLTPLNGARRPHENLWGEWGSLVPLCSAVGFPAYNIGDDCSNWSCE